MVTELSNSMPKLHKNDGKSLKRHQNTDNDAKTPKNDAKIPKNNVTTSENDVQLSTTNDILLSTNWQNH